MKTNETLPVAAKQTTWREEWYDHVRFLHGFSASYSISMPPGWWLPPGTASMEIRTLWQTEHADSLRTQKKELLLPQDLQPVEQMPPHSLCISLSCR